MHLIFFFLFLVSQVLCLSFDIISVKTELRKLMHKKSVSDGQIAVARMHRQIYEKYDTALMLNETGSIFRLTSLGDDFGI